MNVEILQSLFFAINEIFKEGIDFLCAFLIVLGVIFSIIYQMVKR